MNRIVLMVHGGAGPDSSFIRENLEGYKRGLREATETGYSILEEGGSALDAVEAAVNYLEDNPLFNAGRGAALNEKAEVELDASIMDGKSMRSGAVAIIRNVKNPISVARAVMEKTKHVYLGGQGAIEFAKKVNARFCPDAYFITDHAYQEYVSALQEEKEKPAKISHGTVGSVALDRNGNLAAATSTGGIENKATGRIADSSMTGVGAYANNATCAVSGTGDGEYLMQHVVAFHISALVEYKGLLLQDACRYLIQEKLKDAEGDMGVIAIDRDGRFAFEFNSERMHRGWRSSDGGNGVGVYRD